MTACSSITAVIQAPNTPPVTLSLIDLSELLAGPPAIVQARVLQLLELERQRQAPR